MLTYNITCIKCKIIKRIHLYIHISQTNIQIKSKYCAKITNVSKLCCRKSVLVSWNSFNFICWSLSLFLPLNPELNASGIQIVECSFTAEVHSQILVLVQVLGESDVKSHSLKLRCSVTTLHQRRRWTVQKMLWTSLELWEILHQSVRLKNGNTCTICSKIKN